MLDEFLKLKSKLPVLGVGLGLRRDIADNILNSRKDIDFLEFTPENYLKVGGKARVTLETAAALYPIVSHGLTLSIGSTDDLNRDYLIALKKLLDQFDIPWWSDHLSFSTIDGRYMHDLLPISFSRDAVRHVAERIKRVQQLIERPFLIENISYYMTMPGAELTEAQFLSEVLEAADCGLLLDVNNVYVNATNHGYDPNVFLDSIPLERTVQIHIAGHQRGPDMIIDTHGSQIAEPVYELLRYTLARTAVKGILLERDQLFPEFGNILSELAAIRLIARDQFNGKIDGTSGLEAARTPPLQLSNSTLETSNAAHVSDELQQIEKLMCMLCSQQKVREQFLGGENPDKHKHKRQPSIKSLPVDVSQQFDRKGIQQYSQFLQTRNLEVMEAVYPISRKLLCEKWTKIVTEFMERYPPRHYNLNRMGERFPEFIKNHAKSQYQNLPFFPEIVDYEWTWIEVCENDEGVYLLPPEPLTNPAQLRRLRPIVNPTLRIRKYRFPIPDIVNLASLHDRLPEKIEKEPTLVAVFREPHDHEIRTILLGEMAAELLNLVMAKEQSYWQIFAHLQKLVPEMNEDEVLSQYIALIEQLQAQYILTGSVQLD